MNEFQFFYFPCDEILKKSFNPVIDFLKNYFNQQNKNSPKKNRKKFEDKFSYLLNLTSIVEIKENLIRSKSLFAAFLNIYWKDSLYEQLDPKSRFENSLYALKDILKVESKRKPVILIFEDGHSIDEDTKEWLKLLSRNIENYPILIIVTCRYKDSGENYDLYIKEIVNKRLNLKYLSKKGSENLIKSFFNFKVPLKTVGIIIKESEGNPFYIEQIVKYLKENSFLDKMNNLIKDIIEIPTDINSIIIARIDRLTQNLKNAVQTASVLGIEFAVKILQKMLNKKKIEGILKSGEEETIWVTINEFQYIFKHTIIRETAYQMQLKERLRRLHRIAAESFEKVFKNELSEYYDDIGIHYYKAGIKDKAKMNLEKACEYAERKYRNNDAIKYYNILLEIIDSSEEKIKINHKLANTKMVIGDIKDAEVILLETLKLTKKTNNEEYLFKHFNLLTFLYFKQFKLKEAENIINKALELIKDENKVYFGDTYRNMGLLYHFRDNDDKEALIYFKKAEKIFKKFNSEQYGSILSDIAIFCGIHIGLKNVLRYLERSLKIFQKNNDERGISVVYSNIGLTYYEIYLDLDMSKYYYEKAIELDKKIGNKYSLMISTNNIAVFYKYKKKYRESIGFFKKSIDLAYEVGDKRSAVLYQLQYSEIFKRQKKFKKSIEILEDAQRKVIRFKLSDQVSPEILYDKIEVLIQLKDFKKAKVENLKLLNIYKKNKNKDLLNDYIRFKAEIEFYTVNKKNSENILKTLYDKSENQVIKADIIFKLWKLTLKEIYKKDALKLYKDLIRIENNVLKDYIFVERIDVLEKA